MILQARDKWPPTYPRAGSLLFPNNDPRTHRSEWGGEEWRRYAEFLEDAGASLFQRMEAAEAEKRELGKRLSRRKRNPSVPPGKTLLTADWPTKKKPGRPMSDKWKVAADALVVRKELELASGEKVSNKRALAELYARTGKGRWRAESSSGKTVLNAMSEIRNADHNK